MEMARAVLPIGSKGLVAVIRAYFDDSGTHDGAPVVVMAGFVGADDQWDAFDCQWKALLAREGISRLHMTDLSAGAGEFQGWESGRRDAVVHDFRQVIIDAGIAGIGHSVSRPDWDRHVTGHARALLGPAEQHLASFCIHDSVDYAKSKHPGEPLAVIFDSGMAAWDDMMNAARIHLFAGSQDSSPLVSVTPAVNVAFTPLQAADMLAWETYKYAQEWIATDGKAVHRPHFLRMLEKAPIDGGFASPRVIQKMVKSGDMAMLVALEHIIVDLASQLPDPD